jgi:serine protease Do
MKKRNLLTMGGAAALGLALIALPGSSAAPQKPSDTTIARLQQRINELEAKLQAQLDSRADQRIELDGADELGDSAQTIEVMPEIAGDDVNVLIGDDGSSWLGVETHEVTSDKAKELKLNAERGVVLGKVVADSPAAKAGLKENDVVTEINGQRVEGAAQFRRMIHEIPAGRSIQLTVWRDGRSQTISATLGKSEERRRAMKMMAPMPGAFAFRMPEIPEIPSMEWNGNMLFGGGQSRLGIDAEDISGQLGTFFGAPDGEGILVRDVNSGSPAEKAGVKAGDVITSLNGERIRTVGELREKLSAKRDEKDRTVKLGVLRNKGEISLNVELPAPVARTKRIVSRRTNI